MDKKEYEEIPKNSEESSYMLSWRQIESIKDALVLASAESKKLDFLNLGKVYDSLISVFDEFKPIAFDEDGGLYNVKFYLRREFKS